MAATFDFDVAAKLRDRAGCRASSGSDCADRGEHDESCTEHQRYQHQTKFEQGNVLSAALNLESLSATKMTNESQSLLFSV
jgi:hypothetical protein